MTKFLKVPFCRVSSDFFYEQPDWFDVYRTGSSNSTLPWKTKSKFIGLTMQHSPNESINNFQPLHGSRIIIHNTDEFPFRSGQHLHHRTSEIIYIEYTPTMDIIDDALKLWKPEKRNCLMEHEKELKYFKIYTRINCEHECLSEAILQQCNCVPFYMISKSTINTLFQKKIKLLLRITDRQNLWHH